MTHERLTDLLRGPIVVAPMAGGPSTPALVIAAAQAGALGFLAAGMKTTDAMAAEMAVVRAATSEAFGVNVFVPGQPAADPQRTAAYVESLDPDARALDARPGEPAWDDDDWTGKILALLKDPPAIVSFTFGCPSPDVITSFQDVDCAVAVTVTSPAEALAAAEAGADCLVVQGSEAGAHRGNFRNDDFAGLELAALSAAAAQVTDVPQIAAGGIMDARAVVDARAVARLMAGPVVAAQCGTAFLRCPESGAHPAHKAALAGAQFTGTALTRSFSGRLARGLVNRFMTDHPGAPAAYPEINNATRPLRAAAARAGDTSRMSLWAGTGFRAATDRPAGEIISELTPPAPSGR
jgi:nitronate monooxygenase